jgi:hypothetical protein
VLYLDQGGRLGLAFVAAGHPDVVALLQQLVYPLAKVISGDDATVAQVTAYFGGDPVGLLEGEAGLLQGAGEDSAQERNLSATFRIFDQNPSHRGPQEWVVSA